MISTSSEHLRIPPDAVVYIKADGNYSILTTVLGDHYTITRQLGQIEMQLGIVIGPDDGGFIRIGKSIIVNRDYIALINIPKQRLLLSDSRTFKYELSASKEALKSLKEFLEQ